MTVRIMVGDALSQLAELPDGSVHMCMTSPPYWGLRAYKGDPGMIGLEPTFDAHLENLVAVFREVRRVLRSDGTLWLNYGDAYGGESKRQNTAPDSKQATYAGRTREAAGGQFKPKNLMMMPARVAIALQADGWWLRCEIVWHKNNPMPESVKDRPTSAHEKVFLMTKSARCFYDAEAVRTASAEGTLARFESDGSPNFRTGRFEGGDRPETVFSGKVGEADKQRGHGRRHAGFNDRWDEMTKAEQQSGGANLRNVWTIPTHPYSEAHFATFPPALVEPCIKAGTSAHGVCGECGAPWVREVEREFVPQPDVSREKGVKGAGEQKSMGPDSRWDGAPRGSNQSATTGWSPTCDHDVLAVRATCLDPFAGSGTVGLVADRLQRSAILIEISPDYAAMAQRRIEDDAGGLFNPVAAVAE